MLGLHACPQLDLQVQGVSSMACHGPLAVLGLFLIDNSV